jgi:2-methylcitrate dehydratase PrpD
MGLGQSEIATAMALAVSGAGGVQGAFGTDGKSIQVGLAVGTGLAAARLAAAGASADHAVVDEWMELVGGSPAAVTATGAAVPGGLAIKLYPCCYALQRPIAALSTLSECIVDSGDISRITLTTPQSTLAPLRHHRPSTGLQAKFSIEYAAASALIDDYQGFQAFSDAAVGRAEAQRIVSLVEINETPGGDGLLEGTFGAELRTKSGDILTTTLQYPPGSPQRPATPGQLRAKIADCLSGIDSDPTTWTWATVADVLREGLTVPTGTNSSVIVDRADPRARLSSPSLSNWGSVTS